MVYGVFKHIGAPQIGASRFAAQAFAGVVAGGWCQQQRCTGANQCTDQQAKAESLRAAAIVVSGSEHMSSYQRS